MYQISIDIPDEVQFDTKMSETDALFFTRCSVALCLYVQKGGSLGYCAEITGMSKLQFIKFLGEHNVSIFRFEDDEDFLEELDNL